MRGLYHSSIHVDDIISVIMMIIIHNVRMFPVSYTITPSSLSCSSTGLLCWFTRTCSILPTFSTAITIVTVAMPTTAIFIKDMAMEKNNVFNTFLHVTIVFILTLTNQQLCTMQ